MVVHGIPKGMLIIDLISIPAIMNGWLQYSMPKGINLQVNMGTSVSFVTSVFKKEKGKQIYPICLKKLMRD